jgi:exopolyphosphatase/guanosine-5'-triphosphate,3'-diphosphate pyrophosphatase
VLEAQTGHPIITLEGLESLVAQCIEAGDLESLDLPGLSKQRKGVFIGGLVILRSCMAALKLSSIESSPWALREGVLFDLLGHDSISDMRERSVKELANRFHADLQHAERCNTVAQKLLAQVSQSHPLSEIWKRYLHWACLLLEIGLDINHDRFNVHSGYIVENSHLAGFGFEELHRLAFLVRNHRKKPDWTLIEKLPQSDQLEFILVMQVLRVAAVLTRARNDIQDIGWSLSVKNETMTFTAPPPWWDSQPLASADLKAEVRHVKKSPIPFKLG